MSYQDRKDKACAILGHPEQSKGTLTPNQRKAILDALRATKTENLNKVFREACKKHDLSGEPYKTSEEIDDLGLFKSALERELQ